MAPLLAQVAVGGTPPAGLVAAGPGYAVAVAPAKVNLFLELVGQRPDGFHSLETLILPVNLADTVEVERRPGRAVTLLCDAPGVPTDGRNLVAKAAAALARHTGEELGVQVRLTKRIPHEAGLGGGSSDAAATLVALHHLGGYKLSFETLVVIAGRIGSDVAAFLVGPAAWCTGRGEIVEPAAVGGEFHLALIKPPFGLSTAAVYAAAKVPENRVSGRAARAALAAGDAAAVGATLFNRLQPAAVGLRPELSNLLSRMQAAGALGVALTGSGSAVVGVCESAAHAAQVASVARPPERAVAVRAGWN